MMDLSGLISIGGALYDSMTRDDPPDIKPFEGKPVEKRALSDYLPNIDELFGKQADMALSMMRGELPEEVTKQIKMFAGESAIRGGFGSTASRSRNLGARDLGLSQLDLMESGVQLANYLQGQARQLRSDDYSLDISNLNLAYDAWASDAQIRQDNWIGESNRRSNTIAAVAGGVGQLTGAAYMERDRKEDEIKYYNAIMRDDRRYNMLIDAIT